MTRLSSSQKAKHRLEGTNKQIVCDRQTGHTARSWANATQSPALALPFASPRLTNFRISSSTRATYAHAVVAGTHQHTSSFSFPLQLRLTPLTARPLLPGRFVP